MYFDLTGRVAVITGASSGFGVQFARALAGQGADLVIIARRKDKLEAVAEEIRKTGRKCLPVVADVTKTEDIQAAVKAAIAEYGKVDILVNNAGIGGEDPAEVMPDEQWYRAMNLNINAMFVVSREFGKVMIENKYGRIINVASMYGLVGSYSGAAYHASKGAAVNFTRALGAEWAKYNITVNAICPGFFPTELTEAALDTEEFQNFMKATVPMKRYGKDGELNTALLYLAANETSYTTGTTVVVDGGTTCV